jgi:hypothetical protein
MPAKAGPNKVNPRQGRTRSIQGRAAQGQSKAGPHKVNPRQGRIGSIQGRAAQGQSKAGPHKVHPGPNLGQVPAENLVPCWSKVGSNLGQIPVKTRSPAGQTRRSKQVAWGWRLGGRDGGIVGGKRSVCALHTCAVCVRVCRAPRCLSPHVQDRMEGSGGREQQSRIAPDNIPSSYFILYRVIVY